MLDRYEVFALILGLVRANDWDIFPDVARKHASDFPPNDTAVHKKIGCALQDLLSTYDYTESPEFERAVSGKSSAFRAMKARLESEPVKRREHRERLLRALKELPYSDSAFDLVAQSRHAQLRDIQANVATLSSPAAN